MEYIISDSHHGHANIIEYCDRPFDSCKEMDEQMVSRWNSVVGDEDVVYHLGDVAFGEAEEYLNELAGQIVVVSGNHDAFSENPVVPVVDSLTLRHGRYQFLCSHRPQPDFSGWQIHGHIHNNDIGQYPFIHPNRQTVNVSVELIGYKPLQLDELVRLLRKDCRINKIHDVQR